MITVVDLMTKVETTARKAIVAGVEYQSEVAIKARQYELIAALELYCGTYIVDVYKKGTCVVSMRLPPATTQVQAFDFIDSLIL